MLRRVEALLNGSSHHEAPPGGGRSDHPPPAILMSIVNLIVVVYCPVGFECTVCMFIGLSNVCFYIIWTPGRLAAIAVEANRAPCLVR